MSFIQTLFKPPSDDENDGLQKLSLDLMLRREAATQITQLIERLSDPGSDGTVYRHSIYHWLSNKWPVVRRHEGRKHWLNVHGPYCGRPWFDRPLGGRLQGPNVWAHLNWDEAHTLDERIKAAIDAEIAAYVDEHKFENRFDHTPDRDAWDAQAKAEIADALVAFDDGPEPQDETTFHCRRQNETSPPERCRLTWLEDKDTLLVGLLCVMDGNETWINDNSHRFFKYLYTARFSDRSRDKIRWICIGRPNPEDGVPFHFMEYKLSIKNGQFDDYLTDLVTDLPAAFVAQAEALLADQIALESAAYKTTLNEEAADV